MAIARDRFALSVDEMIVCADCRRQPDRLVIAYVCGPPPLRGTGAAGRLMEQVARRARDEGVKIVPLRGDAGTWLRRSREYRDLLA